jgi:hypothetical protein
MYCYAYIQVLDTDLNAAHKCRRGCLNESGQPPLMKGHRCPFRKASQAQHVDTGVDDSTRPSKRQVSPCCSPSFVVVDFVLWKRTQARASSLSGDPTQAATEVTSSLLLVCAKQCLTTCNLLYFQSPLSTTVNSVAVSSAMPLDLMIDPVESAEGNADLNFDGILHFLNKFNSMQIQEMDEPSAMPGWYSFQSQGLSCRIYFLHVSHVIYVQRPRSVAEHWWTSLQVRHDGKLNG